MRAMRFLLTFLLIVVACGDEAGPATEIVVYVDADMAVRGRATDVLVTVAGRANTEPDFVVAETIELTTDVLPFQFNFAPRDGDVSRQWEVIVQARDGAAPFVEKAARGIYVEDQSRVLYMVLRNDCADFPACTDPEETCDGGTCRTSIRTPDVLPVYEGGRVPPPDMPDPVCVTDGDCDDGIYCNGPSTCDPMAPAADARGCVNGALPCPPPDACDEGAMECMTGGCEMPDADDDGVNREMCGGNDCDDEDGDNFPGNAEVDDGADNDCDGEVDEGLVVDCSEVPAEETTEAACSDGCDNDENGWTDCDDFQCRGTVVCGACETFSYERNDTQCSDGCDNDGNGFADCDDFQCDGFAACTGTNRPCDCDADEACLTRRAYGFSGTCGFPCTVGEDADTSRPGIQPNCPTGQTCWWRGTPTDTDGVCAEFSPGLTPPPMPPNIGSRCATNADCASPLGWGRCLTGAAVGFEDGYCTVLDCAAPGLPTGVDVCGPEAHCVGFDNTSYCFDACVGDSECRSGYICVDGITSLGSICLRECAGAGGCGANGVCDTAGGKSFCRPPSST